MLVIKIDNKFSKEIETVIDAIQQNTADILFVHNIDAIQCKRIQDIVDNMVKYKGFKPNYIINYKNRIAIIHKLSGAEDLDFGNIHYNIVHDDTYILSAINIRTKKKFWELINKINNTNIPKKMILSVQSSIDLCDEKIDVCSKFNYDMKFNLVSNIDIDIFMDCRDGKMLFMLDTLPVSIMADEA